MLTKKDFTSLEKKFASKNDLIALEKRQGAKFQDLEDKFDNKFNQMMNMLDSVMGEIKAMREEQTVMFYQIRNNTEQLGDHEGRIKIIETGLVG